ncbi:hypothetical protein BIV57_13275 [Mangrovactinospora gilvigrisea]|uniref:NADP-dependent oxidoreductase domain-containing protein n=2 Tax=Mangrovactinospora gilvigrisea TaxID=1428644 RepID=A0A1J7BE47_9ACTN|nr:hypothetical protein BIV57_13275 [Mangrovactinospora gilvigrisea]
MQLAYELGATVLDVGTTAASQRLAGHFLRNVVRDQVVVAATIPATRMLSPDAHWAPTPFRRRLHRFLTTLNTDHLDILTLNVTDLAHAEPALIGAQLQAVHQQGLFQHLALALPESPHRPPRPSSRTAIHGPALIHALIHAAAPACLVADCNALTAPGPTGWDPVALASEHGLALLATDPLAHGLLLGRGARAPQTVVTDGGHKGVRSGGHERAETINRYLPAIHRRFGISTQDLARAFLRMTLQRHPRAVVLCDLTADCGMEYVTDLGTPLTDDDTAFLARWSARLRRRLADLGRPTTTAPS